jgi:hypothetical protein
MQSSVKGENNSAVELIALIYRFSVVGNGFGAKEIPGIDTNRKDSCNNSPNTG